MKRKINQDNYFFKGHINENHKNHVFMLDSSSKNDMLLGIFDGMGGEKNGEIASFITAKALEKYAENHKDLIESFDEHISSFVQIANTALCAFIKENNGERSGSTMALLCISLKKGEAVASNIGDTKAFLLRNNELIRLSIDHNRAQTLVDMGIITEDEARTHKDKSKLTQHIGIFPDEMIIEPFITDNIIIKEKDLFMLCSDGLTDMLDYNEIKEILTEKAQLKDKCKKLVERANAGGGEDNVTVILAEII